MIEHAYLIPILPLLAAALIAAAGAKVLRGQAHWIAILGIVAAAVLAMGSLAAISGGHASVDERYLPWIHVGQFQVDFGMLLDPLSALFVAFVTGIGTLIFIYSAGYMKGDYSYWRFFAYLSLFVFFMTVLVLGHNFLLLYLGWEGVGLASYLLIGYYYPRPAAVAAAKKAFIVNRIGDFGFAIGIFLIYLTFGSLDYSAVLNVDAIQTALAAHPAVMWIPFLLMLGAFGKSAQFPLHVWLPDAMEGPTPVSALIHAATMVTAGIYMIARCMPLFAINHAALMTVACVGTFTAFMAASIAFCQYDIKRIWAYSTLSQLGYMFLGLGVSASIPAVFHVVTHAFFKALLFLAAGSVMHAMGGELDIRKMSGLRKVLPITCWTMLIGCLALAGVPGLSGFFSKDEILSAAVNSPSALGQFLGYVGLLVALMTAYYTFRAWFRVFGGPLVLPATAGGHEPSPFALPTPAGHIKQHEPKRDVGDAEASHGADEHEHDAHGTHAPNDGPASMWLPLIVLAIGAIFVGYIGVGAVWHSPQQIEGGWIHHLLDPVLGTQAGEGMLENGKSVGAAPRITSLTLQIISGVLAIIGIAIAYFFHWSNRSAATMLAARLRPLVTFLENRWYIDEFYNYIFVQPLRVLGHLLFLIDKLAIDGVVYVVSSVPGLVGYTLKPTQRGLLQRYAVGMVAGLAAIVLGVLMILFR